MANKNITFTLEYHRSCLKNSCRICGNRAQTFAEITEGKKPHFCDQHKDKIYIFYGIDVKYDSDLHPKVMCSACMNRVKNAKVLSVDTKIDKECYLGEKEKVQIVSELWKPHSRINCKLCMKHDRENKGGRPKKASKRRGRPKMQQKTDIISSNLFSHFFTKKGMMTQKITKMWKYTMYPKDKSKHIFVQYVSIYFGLHLSKPDVITIFVQKLFP